MKEQDYDDEPINIFPRNVPLKEKRWGELSGVEWTQRCIDQDWEKDRPDDTRWGVKGIGLNS